MEMKRSDERFFMCNERPSVEAAKEIFNEFAVHIDSGNIRTKMLNVYGIIEEAASLFQIPIPKIMLLNTGIPNASASEVSPHFGLTMITSGLLMRLNEKEILLLCSLSPQQGIS